jgi:5'-3' exonuclease
MSRTWLVLDVPFLCWRAYHTTGDLSHQGVTTGTLFGFYRSLKTLQSHSGSDRFVFCFDLPPYLRKNVSPGYKSNRSSPDEDVKRQIELLRTDQLERVGFKNVFYQKGYEADDVIASVVNNLKAGDKAIVVSADHDLYQLLNKDVTIHAPSALKARPSKTVNRKWFVDEYAVTPEQWPLVKAIAGCPSDNVVGVYGVGETIACAHVAGRTVNLPSKRAIEAFVKTPQYETNLKLVKLPYPGCRDFKPIEDKVEPAKWDELMASLGMRSLVARGEL